MKTAFYLTTLTATTVLLTAASLNAAPIIAGTAIGVDFGPTAPTNFYNQVSSTSAGSIAAGAVINTSGVSVDGVGFSWSANNAWFNNNDSLDYVGQPAVFNDSNTTDWMGISDSGGPTGVITLTFTGLNNAFTYDLVIGARFGTTNANTSWTVDGQTLLADATSDTNAFRSFTGLSTDGFGNLAMTGTGATARLDIATVSALHLIAVPEPGTLGLLGLLGLGGVLIAARRRRN